MQSTVAEVFVLICGTPGHLSAARQAIEQILCRAYEAGDAEAVRTLNAVAALLTCDSANRDSDIGLTSCD